MKTIGIILLALLINGTVGLSQELTFKQKKTIANEVFENLVRTKGHLNKPAFKMVRTLNRGTYLDRNTGVIYMEERAFDVCWSLGKDAIASLLAHEIIHFYKHKENHASFLPFVFEDNSMTPKNIKDSEEEADCLGGFLAHTAGYKTFEIMPQLLEKLYSEYDKETDDSNYPNLENRQEAAKEAQKKTLRLASVFDLGNTLHLLNQFEAADGCYQYILRFYEGKEIFNNAGINAAMAALQYGNPPSYLYPFEVSTDTRLRQTRSHNNEDVLATRTKWLEKGLDYLKSAIRVDETYAIAYLNRGCVYDILRQSSKEKAHYWKLANRDLEDAFDYARKQKATNILAGAYILKGIFPKTDRQNESSPINYLDSAQLYNINAFNFIAQYNQLKSKGNLVEEIRYREEVEKKEVLPTNNQKALTLFDHDITLGDSFIITLQTTLYSDSKKHLLINEEDTLLQLNFTYPNYPYSTSTSKTIKIGSTWEEVTKVYGQPIPSQYRFETSITDSEKPKRLKQYSSKIDVKSTSGGNVLIYKVTGIVFFFDKENKVKYWGVYQ